MTLDKIIAANSYDTLHENYLKSLKAVDDPTKKLYKAYLIFKADHAEPNTEFFVRPTLLIQYESLKSKMGKLSAYDAIAEASRVDDIAECQVFALSRPARFDGEPSKLFKPLLNRFNSEVLSTNVTRESFNERRVEYVLSIRVGMPNDSSNYYYDEYAKIKHLHQKFLTPFQIEHQQIIDITKPNELDDETLQASFEKLEQDYLDLQGDSLVIDERLDEAFRKLFEFCEKHPDYCPLRPRKHIPRIVIYRSQSVVGIIRKSVQSLVPGTNFSEIHHPDIGSDDEQSI